MTPTAPLVTRPKYTVLEVIGFIYTGILIWSTVLLGIVSFGLFVYFLYLAFQSIG